MRGIVGLVSTSNIVPRLVRGLQQLDQPGHNTCGLAVHGRPDNTDWPPGLHRQRWACSVSQWQPDDVDDALQRLQGRAGLACTEQLVAPGSRRMPQVLPQLSHGPQATLNSPARVAVVHQGSLDNPQVLREALVERGYTFKSPSDTEVIAHLLDAIHQGHPVQTLHRALGLLSGPVALGVMFLDQAERLFVVQRGVPLHWGTGPGHAGWSSDPTALPPGTTRVTPLRPGKVLDICPDEGGVSHRLHGG